MKKFILFIGILLSVSAASAQKFAYVDTDYILRNIPDYTSAKKELNSISVKWQKEIEDLLAEVDKMYNDYQVEKILLTEDLRIKREEEIVKKEREVKDLQMKRFGADGDLFKKQQELIKPIQDRVYTAISEIAENKGYGMVFDKAGSTTVLFSMKKYDISDDVIEQLGYIPGANEEDDDTYDEDDEDGGGSGYDGGGTNRNDKNSPK